jgi:2-dehydropantoate 2-reductase
MRYIIHGAGALGSLVGGRLAATGAEVLLIGREPHVAAIRDRGLELRLTALAEEPLVIRDISAATTLAGIVPREDDRILLAVKSADTPAALLELGETFSRQTPVFCLQNGVRNEDLAARRFLHAYGIMAGLVTKVIAPGIVAQTLYNDLAIGSYPLGCDRVGREVADHLARAGFNVTVPDSIMAVKWSKLILNLNNATLAIIDCHLQLAMVTPVIAGFMARVVEEALVVLERNAIPVDDPGGPYRLKSYLENLRRISHGPADPRAIAAAADLPFEKRAYPSTWVDLKERRGRTEAGFLNGEIVRMGEKHSIPTPLNTTLLELVERLAGEGRPPGLPGLLDPDQLTRLAEAR